jgi:hypothetical protein
MATVAEVVAVIHVIDVNVVGLIPIGRPGFRPRINNREPEAAVLKARASIDDDHGSAVNAEIVSTAKMLAEPIGRNAIAHIASAVVPRTVIVFPMLSALARPDVACWTMRRLVPVFARVFVRWPVMRLMNFWPVCLLLVLGRTYVVPWFRPIRLVIVAMLWRSLVAMIVARVVSLLVLGATVMVLSAPVIVVIVPMLCVRRSACC